MNGVGARRKDILFLTHRLPYPPDKGDKIRTFHQLDHLALSHNVYCACFVDSRADLAAAPQMRRWCADVAAVPWQRDMGIARAGAALLRGRALSIGAYDDARMHRIVKSWSRSVSFDAVVAFSACMAPYAMRAHAKRRVLDLCDVDSAKWLAYAQTDLPPRRWLHACEGRRLAAFERSCVQQFDDVLVITSAERHLLDAHDRHGHVHVVGNGVTIPGGQPRPASSRGPVIAFVGAMDYRPNVEGAVWFVRKVWPLIRARLPGARLLLVGRHPVAAVRRLRRVAGVAVTGKVARPQPYLDQARVVIAPLLVARGLQNKVLEAMAAHRPVVCTSAVARGLDAIANVDVLVADDGSAFSEAVLELCESDARCEAVAAAGHRYVSRYHPWREILERFERIVLGEGIIQQARGRVPRPVAASATTVADQNRLRPGGRNCALSR